MTQAEPAPFPRHDDVRLVWAQRERFRHAGRHDPRPKQRARGLYLANSIAWGSPRVELEVGVPCAIESSRPAAGGVRVRSTRHWSVPSEAKQTSVSPIGLPLEVTL